MKQHQEDIISPAVLLIGMLGGKQRDRVCSAGIVFNTVHMHTNTYRSIYFSGPSGYDGLKRVGVEMNERDEKDCDPQRKNGAEGRACYLQIRSHA